MTYEKTNKKSQKAHKKEQKKGKENPIIAFFKGVRVEIGKVVWPSRKQTLNHTIIVIVGSLITAIFLGGFDLLFTYIIETITK